MESYRRGSGTRWAQFVLVAFLLLIATCALEGQGNVSADGVLVESNMTVLFTRAHCKESPPAGGAQLLISTDGGRSWKRRGPRLDGYEFDFASQKDGKVWIAGQHTAEGPETNPFIFVPGESGTDWQMRTIREGNGPLKRLAWGSKGELNAWIQHLRLADEGWAGPTYIHQSLDGGRTWKVLGRSRDLHLEAVEFKDIGEIRNPLWRIVDARVKSGELILQRRESKESPWKRVLLPRLLCSD